MALESSSMDLPEDGLFGFGGMLDFDPVTGGEEGTMDDLFETLQTCTHRHICNPPGPDNTHTHSCSHTHTQLLAAPEVSCSTGDQTERGDEKDFEKMTTMTTESKKRSLGNREAVRKYRERKKAHTAQLEDQLAKERERNQQLMKRLQAQTALEAEVVRLRALLSEIRGKVDAEIGPNNSSALSFRTFAPDRGGGGHPGTPVQLIPINTDPSGLPGSHGQYYLQTVDLPCEPQLPCMQKSLRVLKTHPGTAACPACDVGNGSCMVETKGEKTMATGDCVNGSDCPPLLRVGTVDTLQQVHPDVSGAGGL